MSFRDSADAAIRQSPVVLEPLNRHQTQIFKARGLHINVRRTGRHPVDELQVANGCKEAAPAARLVLPAFARLKAKRRKEAREPVEGTRRARRAHHCDCLDHSLLTLPALSLRLKCRHPPHPSALRIRPNRNSPLVWNLRHFRRLIRSAM